MERIESSRFFVKLHEKLQEKNFCTSLLAQLEGFTKINRVYLFLCFFGLLSLLLLKTYGFPLIAVCSTFLYPACRTLKALEDRDLEPERKRLLIYWFIFAAVNFYEVSFFFITWIPAYEFCKMLFLIFCYLPLERNGADYIYTQMIRPFYEKNQVAIDNAINSFMLQAYSMYGNADLNADGPLMNRSSPDSQRRDVDGIVPLIDNLRQQGFPMGAVIDQALRNQNSPNRQSEDVGIDNLRQQGAAMAAIIDQSLRKRSNMNMQIHDLEQNINNLQQRTADFSASIDRTVRNQGRPEMRMDLPKNDDLLEEYHDINAAINESLRLQSRPNAQLEDVERNVMGPDNDNSQQRSAAIAAVLDDLREQHS